MKLSGTLFALILTVLFSVLLTAAFRILYGLFHSAYLLSCYITFLTISYHFLMRVLVGEGITLLYRNRAFSYHSFWYRQHRLEKQLYRLIRIKKWKVKVITAKPEQFDIRARTYEELIHNITQAEVVHEIIMLLSFVPLILIRWYGSAFVFITTSVIACLVDSLFVMIQRYNRPRLLQLKQKIDARSA